MRVLLTGGRGFLGRHMQAALAGHDILSLVRSSSDVPPHDVTEVVGDLSSPGPWTDAVSAFAPEWCFHLAWDGLPDYSLARCRANLDANIRLIELLASIKVGRVVVAGTCWEYGNASGPQSEDAGGQEVGIFAATKHAICTVLDSVARQAGFDYRWARIFFAYGEGQRRQSLVPYLGECFRAGVVPSLREPNAVQDFVHVSDVARGLVALAACDAPSGTFNLGSGQPTTVAEISNRVAEYYARSKPFPFVSPEAGFWADPRRTLAASDWRPVVTLSEGIPLTLRALEAAL